MNNRANIMFFIEQLCDMARRENHLEFVRMVQRDILRIIDAVAPSDGTGAANVKVVRKVNQLQCSYPFPPFPLLLGLSVYGPLLTKKHQVLSGLQEKKVLLPETIVELEECLKERDTALSPDGNQDNNNTTTASKDLTPTTANKPSGLTRPDKRQIEQRIEEDRERHKRLRESIWAVKSEDNMEFERLWEDTSDIGEDDFVAAEDDAYERRRAVREVEYVHRNKV